MATGGGLSRSVVVRVPAGRGNHADKSRTAFGPRMDESPTFAS
jgi:hypothetical protein